MAGENPTSAIDAILEEDKEIGNNGLRIYPLTLGRYALLELVKSPLINKETEFSTLTLIPTFYIMTREVSELKGFNSRNIEELEQKSMEWAETQTINESGKILDELLQKFNLVQRVKPDVEEDTKKKDRPQTDGLPA
jgi:hypothetical protein